jgi:Na+-transporting NADH:ubiquinone oxidoreductase subunit B
MRFLRELLDKQAHHFEKGGKLEKLYPLWEANDTILFTPDSVTKGRTHVRDGIDLKRMMITVVIALIPALAMALYNTGHIANEAISSGAGQALDTWQSAAMQMLFGGFAPSLFADVVHGALYFIPLFAITGIVGGGIEVATAMVRNHEVNEGFLVTLFLFPMILPPTLPLWQAGLGIAFGVLLAKEVFGGTAMNVLNVALTARAFLFFAYPGQISGDSAWVAAKLTDASTGATWLSKAAAGTAEYTSEAFTEAFMGFIPGSMGETSVIACLIGAVILIATQIASWRTMVGVAVGTAAVGGLLNAVGSDTNVMFDMPFYWHYVLGGWAFGTVFMATDPVTSPFTEKGKLIYGFLIGAMVVLVRVVNPAYPEGMMLAILFMNMFAPFVDHFFVQGNIKRRLARHG